MPDDNTEVLREEIKNLRAQLEELVKTAGEKRSEITHEVMEKLTKEIEELRKHAGHRAHQLYEAGNAGLDDISERVRRNPLASLAIAFGAGCVLSCLLRHLR